MATSRRPLDYDGYPDADIRAGIRSYGTPQNRRTLRAWETFLRGDTDREPPSLAEWIRGFHAAEDEVKREDALDRRRTETDKLMRKQIRLLQESLGKGFDHSPVNYIRFIPKNVMRGARWRPTAAYMHSWVQFMKGERDLPPAPSRWWRQQRLPEEFVWHPELRERSEDKPQP